MPQLTAKQREFIAEKLPLLGEDTHRVILQIVQMSAPDCILKNSSPNRTSLDLNRITEPELVLQLYNMVYHRLKSLNEPARGARDS